MRARVTDLMRVLIARAAPHSAGDILLVARNISLKGTCP